MRKKQLRKKPKMLAKFAKFARIAIYACIGGLLRDSSGMFSPGRGAQERSRGKEHANADAIGIGGFPRWWETGLRPSGNALHIVSPAGDIALKLNQTRPNIRAAV
jgi:hypothetical protein